MPVLERYPVVTLMVAFSRVGGYLSLYKLYGLGLYFIHKWLFEKRLSKFHKHQRTIASSEEELNIQKMTEISETLGNEEDEGLDVQEEYSYEKLRELMKRF